MHRRAPNVSEDEEPRSMLMISSWMAWMIVYIGRFGNFAMMLFMGFSLFLVICCYGFMSGYSYFLFYAGIGYGLQLFYIFAAFFCCVVCATYCVFGWFFLPTLSQKIAYFSSFIAAIIAISLSLDMVGTDMAYKAMSRRESMWWNKGIITSDYYSSVMSPQITKDITRCIFIWLMGIIFTVTFQNTNMLFINGFSIAPKAEEGN